ncbi:hypothetical protein [Spirosoma rhododendri]|uniref:Uncharacterized protein n=1 Tax=Spirosoma rhododendri TaxID=2728024 RepID=A0A7L5DKA9_9BACT|nr:hypothetical protein [Spirosoma rhododendri]QJD78545.1 hypothetical protein HH216_09000 [Spirosoma rhododendri]
METNQPTRLNAMQQYMLRLFERELPASQEAEIKQLLASYFSRLVDDEIDALVSERGITAEQLEKDAAVHRRTPYNPKR